MSYMLEALSASVQASALDLSQNGIATLEFQDQHRRLYHVTTLLVGRLGDLWEWTVLNHQHLPIALPIAEGVLAVEGAANTLEQINSLKDCWDQSSFAIPLLGGSCHESNALEPSRLVGM